jgi:hypothetical protein
VVNRSEAGTVLRSVVNRSEAGTVLRSVVNRSEAGTVLRSAVNRSEAGTVLRSVVNRFDALGGTNGDNVDAQLQTLIDLQGFDGKIAGLESEAARLPRQIESLQTALAEAKKAVETIKTKVDSTRKDLRTKEKDLEVANVKRQKLEAKLYEVKTNKEYSAVLLEIEEAKQEKAKTEEDILGLMEMQERLAVDIKDTEQRFKTREDQARQDEAAVRKKLAAVEQELSIVRVQRASRAKELPAGVLASYDRILKARGGVAVAAISAAGVCGGCRVGIRPQALQELRAGTVLMLCESCGRYLYWQE